MYLVLILFLWQSVSDVQLKFDKANQLLKEQDFEQALLLYRELKMADFESGALYLNSGLAYTQLDSLGMAKADFLQAADFDDTREQALEGLSYITKKLPQKAAALPKMPWDNLLEWTVESGISFWVILGSVLLYLSFLFLVLYWFKLRDNKWILNLFFGGIFLSAAFFAAAFYTQYVNNRYGKAVLIKNQSTLYEAASSSSSVISLAFEGYEFTVDFTTSAGNPEWVYVRMSNGVFGWIPKQDLIQYK
jgi:tetratricopeptide (TPR) repeat protein